VTGRESNPRPVGASSGDSITHLKRSAVMSDTGIHRLIYRDICVERGASYAAYCSQQRLPKSSLPLFATGAERGRGTVGDVLRRGGLGLKVKGAPAATN